MVVTNPRDLGRLIRQERRRRRMSQTQLCVAASVSRTWLSEFEAGKPTVELGRAFKVISALGLALTVGPAPSSEFDLDDVLRAYAQRPDVSRG